MFCINCGNKIKEGEVFCTNCGNLNSSKSTETNDVLVKIVKDEKWWHRLMRVFYIISYLPLLGIIPLVWSENTPYCSSFGRYCSGSYWEAFWYSLITLVIYIVSIRLIKLAVIYIAFGQKPKLKKELKKLY